MSINSGDSIFINYSINYGYDIFLSKTVPDQPREHTHSSSNPLWVCSGVEAKVLYSYLDLTRVNGGGKTNLARLRLLRVYCSIGKEWERQYWTIVYG